MLRNRGLLLLIFIGRVCIVVWRVIVCRVTEEPIGRLVVVVVVVVIVLVWGSCFTVVRGAGKITAAKPAKLMVSTKLLMMIDRQNIY